MGDTQEKAEKELQYQMLKKKNKRVLKRNLQNVLTETLKLLVNSGEK